MALRQIFYPSVGSDENNEKSKRSTHELGDNIQIHLTANEGSTSTRKATGLDGINNELL